MIIKHRLDTHNTIIRKKESRTLNQSQFYTIEKKNVVATQPTICPKQFYHFGLIDIPEKVGTKMK